jgi:tRNA nucleotidyltransferase (CCA-adding enzyme)
MEIYLVGGAVRDQLLGLPVNEKDWVVTGATPADMIKLGYRQVGKDFPVFLHPETHEEYALARIERKTGAGYAGFAFDASPQVTLEEDLLRRDLTINAIAQTADGQLLDPYGGQPDIKKKILRHVSRAFIEDPVRVLRVARFAARFAQYGFTVADETKEFMREMVRSGEINSLVAERVWKELERALQEKNPEQFFQVLSACEALPVLFPESRGTAIGLLAKVSSLTPDAECRFAAWLFHLSEAQIKILCDRYRIPAAYRDLALLVVKHYQVFRAASDLTAQQLLELLQVTDAFRRADRFKKILYTCEIIAQAQGEDEFNSWLLALHDAVKTVNFIPDQALSLQGKEIGEHIARLRLAAIENFLQPARRSR